MRMRGIKPELFSHEGLFDAEMESGGLPLRLAFVGLWCVADREGRFSWRPRGLKSMVLPFDDGVDFSKVLAALEKGGFVLRYEVDGAVYGWIPSFTKHQRINQRESKSIIPPHPNDENEGRTCMHVQDDAEISTDDDDEMHARGKPHRERKGKERNKKGIGMEGGASAGMSEDVPSSIPQSEEEAWQYARNLPVTPGWTRRMVGYWWDNRTATGWTRGGEHPRPVSDWRADLRSCYQWAQKGNGGPQTVRPAGDGSGEGGRNGFPSAQNGNDLESSERKAGISPQKIKAGPNGSAVENGGTPEEMAMLEAVRTMWPEYSGTAWADVPQTIRRRVRREWMQARELQPVEGV